MIRNFLASIALLCVLGVSTAQAELVQVPFDDFSDLVAIGTSNPPGGTGLAVDTDTYSIGSFTFERVVTATGANAIGGSALLDFSPGANVNYAYTITAGGDFGAFFAAYRDGTLGGNSAGPTINPTNNPAIPFDGFAIDANTVAGAFTLTVSSGGLVESKSLENGLNVFRPDFSPGATSMSFNVSSSTGGVYGLNSVSAVPEPTAFLMFGSALAGFGLMPRRRRG